MIDMSDQLVGDPGCMLEEPDNFETHVKVIETEFRTFQAEFSNFCLENMSNNIQADLDNVKRAQFIMNETLTSNMDTFNRELSSQMNELKELIQNRVKMPKNVPGPAKRDQPITEEIIFGNKMEDMHQAYTIPHHIIGRPQKEHTCPHLCFHLPIISHLHPCPG